MSPLIPFKGPLMKVKIEKAHLLPSLDEYFSQMLREGKAKSRMFTSLQPSEPYSENTQIVLWTDKEDKILDLEALNRLFSDHYAIYDQVKEFIQNNQFLEREDSLLNLLDQIDLRYVRMRHDFSQIKNNIEMYRMTLLDSKERAQKFMKQISSQVAQFERDSINTHQHSQQSHTYSHNPNFNPRRFKHNGPKSYPCKYYHGPRGCGGGDNCQFIHEEQYKGMRIPYSEMDRVIHNQMEAYKNSIKGVQQQIDQQFKVNQTPMKAPHQVPTMQPIPPPPPASTMFPQLIQPSINQQLFRSQHIGQPNFLFQNMALNPILFAIPQPQNNFPQLTPEEHDKIKQQLEELHKQSIANRLKQQENT